MPFYDFECKDCKNKFTVRTSYKERDKTTCPKCKSGNVKHIFSSFAVGSSSGGNGAPRGACPQRNSCGAAGGG